MELLLTKGNMYFIRSIVFTTIGYPSLRFHLLTIPCRHPGSQTTIQLDEKRVQEEEKREVEQNLNRKRKKSTFNWMHR